MNKLMDILAFTVIVSIFPFTGFLAYGIDGAKLCATAEALMIIFVIAVFRLSQ